MQKGKTEWEEELYFKDTQDQIKMHFICIAKHKNYISNTLLLIYMISLLFVSLISLAKFSYRIGQKCARTDSVK